MPQSVDMNAPYIFQITARERLLNVVLLNWFPVRTQILHLKSSCAPTQIPLMFSIQNIHKNYH